MSVVMGVVSWRYSSTKGGRMADSWQPWLILAVLLAPPAKKGAKPADAPASLERHEYAQIQMGMSFKITLYAPDEKTANLAARSAYDRIERLNDILSDYDEKSELSRLSDTADSGKTVAVSDDLWRVLIRSQEVSRDTSGAFDITVGPLVRLWRQARILKTLPAEERLTAARKAVGYEAIRLDEKNRTATLTRPGMRLDAGGIGAGFAADEALAVLKKHGITRALIDASGDVAVGDPPPDKPGWRIGIAPLAAKGPPSRYLTLKNCAISTSGDVFQFVEIAGKRYSHIVDPKTGLGLTTRSSVTLVAKDCTTADAYATAVSVLGPKRGMEVIDRLEGAAAFIVQGSDGKAETHSSRRWNDLNAEAPNDRSSR
jgi:thiamine biosynthesis lipoprotein